MKILFVLEHFYPYIGGAEKLFYELSTSLVKEGYEVVVVTSKYDTSLLANEVHKGVKIVRVNCYNRFGFTFFSLPKIYKHAKRCNLIHTTTYNAALPALIVAKLLNKPVYVTFHEVWGKLWKKLPFMSYFGKHTFYVFEKMLLKLPFDKFIAVSEFTRSKLIESGILESKIKRIYNGIDYKKFEGYEHRKPKVFTFTYFGRLGVSKGLDLLIPAASEFRETYPECKFKLIIPKLPNGVYYEILKLVSFYRMESYIEYMHNLPKEGLYGELLKSSCVIISSYSEGFCFAAAESVALGVPIISSNQGALSEVVSGRFINMKEQTSKALFEAMQKAFLNEWKVTEVKQFHLRDSILEYTNLYGALSLKN